MKQKMNRFLADHWDKKYKEKKTRVQTEINEISGNLKLNLSTFYRATFYTVMPRISATLE